MAFVLRLKAIIFLLSLLIFSQAFGQVPESWMDDSDINTFKESTIIFDGQSSCGIEVTSGTQANCDLSNLVEIPVTGGESFKFSFWYFTSENVRLRAAFDWNVGNATYSSEYAGPTASGDWEEFSYEGFVPADVTTVNLRIRSYDIVGGFTAPETQYVDQVIFESPVGNALAVANGNFENWPSLLPEPTNYPDDFSAAATDQQIELLWSDAGGAQVPDAYLILASDENNITAPVDGNFVSNDFDFSDGSGAVNVAYGIENFTFLNLNPETTYYFQIYPYTNLSQDVDFKNDGTAPAANATTGIMQAEIIVTAPEAGEYWFRGQSYDVVWDAVNVMGDVSIEISDDASSGNPVWTLLATVSVNNGNFPWLIPVAYPTGDDFQFRVTSLQESVSGLSGIFSIMDEPDIYNIVINEIMYNPPPELGDDDYWEFLEIYNNDLEIVDLSGWVFTEGFDFTFPEETFLGVGEYLVIARNPDTLAAYYGISNLLGPFEDGALNNGGELVELSDAVGNVVDQLEYNNGGDWPSEPDGDGPSLSLMDPDLDNSLPESWEPSIVMFGTPGLPNNPTEPLIQVVFPNGGENLQQGISYEITWNFIELSGTVSIELSSLSGNSEVLATNVDIAQLMWNWDLPVDQALGNDFKIMIKSNSNPEIWDESDALFSVIEEVITPNIVINEIMYNPPDALGLDDHWEYLEIYNNDMDAVDLSDWFFTQGFDFIFPAGTTLAAGDYLVIARNPDTIAAYYGINNLVGPFDGGALNNSGETIELSDALGTAVDVVSYLDIEPWPVEPDGDGPSLSLINPNFDNNLPESWEASIVLYGTPGLLNHPTDPLIAVIYPNGGESIQQGLPQEITWNYSEVQGSVSIELLNLSGDNEILAQGIDIGLETWIWEVPIDQSTGNNFKIKIFSEDNTEVADESDAVFSIIAAQPIPNLVITEIMYNPPESDTDSLEFIEVYNNDNFDVDLTGYSFGSGVNFTFPEITLNAGDYILLAVDSMAMQNTFDVAAWQWDGGALSNGGELISLLDNFENLIDEVEYDDALPWDTLADGGGPSLTLCDPNSDNSLPENWLASAELAAVNAEGNSIFATPGGPCITTKLSSVEASQIFDIYPNPSRGIFTFAPQNSGSWKIEIFNLRGDKLFSGQRSQNGLIDVSEKLAPGMYLIKVSDLENRISKIKKLIIE